jgi:hypothetical protein
MNSAASFAAIVALPACVQAGDWQNLEASEEQASNGSFDLDFDQIAEIDFLIAAHLSME